MDIPVTQLLDGMFSGVAQEMSGRELRLQAGTDSSCQSAFSSTSAPSLAL